MYKIIFLDQDHVIRTVDKTIWDYANLGKIYITLNDYLDDIDPFITAQIDNILQKANI